MEAGLLKFEGDLDTCFRIMHRCNRTRDLDASQVLKCLFKKLPTYLQNRWDKEVLKTPDRVPTYELLMKVVREEHDRKTSEINAWREDPRPKKEHDRGGEGVRQRSSKVNSAKVADQPPIPVAPLGSSLPACLCGPQGRHDCLANCPAYGQAPNVTARWELIKHSRVCFRCLKYGHRADRCSEGTCSVPGCGRHHHILLHQEQRENHSGSRYRRNRSDRPGHKHPPRQAPRPGTNPEAPPFRQPSAPAVEQSAGNQK